MEMTLKVIWSMLISELKLFSIFFFSALYIFHNFVSFSVSINKAEMDCWLENCVLENYSLV